MPNNTLDILQVTSTTWIRMYYSIDWAVSCVRKEMVGGGRWREFNFLTETGFGKEGEKESGE